MVSSQSGARVIDCVSRLLPTSVFSNESLRNQFLGGSCIYTFGLKPYLYIMIFFFLTLTTLFISQVYIMYKNKYMVSFYFKINQF